MSWPFIFTWYLFDSSVYPSFIGKVLPGVETSTEEGPSRLDEDRLSSQPVEMGHASPTGLTQKHVKISPALPTTSVIKHSPPPNSPTKRGEKPKPPPKPTLKMKPALPPKTILDDTAPVAVVEKKVSVDGKVKGVPNYTTV